MNLIHNLLFQLGYETEIYKNLTEAAKKLNSFTVYKHEQIPDRLHVKNCRRQSDLLLVAHINYGFTDAVPFKGRCLLNSKLKFVIRIFNVFFSFFSKREFFSQFVYCILLFGLKILR